jgi:hypothetical protein
MEDLKCLIYTSVISPYCDQKAMEDILTTARNANKLLDITGILLHTPRLFMQYIEGPVDNICTLFGKIKLDNRHNDIFLCHFSSIEQRIFPDWQMGYKDLTSNTVSINGLDHQAAAQAIHKFSNQFVKREEIFDVLKLFL